MSNFQHMTDRSRPLSAYSQTMVGAGAPDYSRQYVSDLDGDDFDDEDDDLDGEDDEDDDLGDDEDDDLGDDEDDDLGDDEDDDLGDDEDDDLGDDEAYGMSERKRARLLGRRRRLIAKWHSKGGHPVAKARIRKRVRKLSEKLGLPMPPGMDGPDGLPGRGGRGGRRAARRGGAPAFVPAAQSAPADRRVFKPGMFRKPQPVPGAPSAVSTFVAPGVIAPVAMPGAQAYPSLPARRAAAFRNFEREAPGVRTGPGGATWTREGEPGRGAQWTRTGPGGRTQEFERGPRGGLRRVSGEEFGAAAEPKAVTNIGSAMIAFPFQSLAVVAAAAVAGAFIVPKARKVVRNWRNR